MRSKRIGTITSKSANMYDGPSTGGDVLETLGSGSIVTVLREHDGWYTVHNAYANVIGYIADGDIEVSDVTQLFIPDLYWKDANGDPRWDKLYNDARYAGAIIKTSEGLAGDVAAAEGDWFRYNWGLLGRVGGNAGGLRWFRGCYHFLRLVLPAGMTTQEFGRQQACEYLKILRSAGGLSERDLPPIVDVEHSGPNENADDANQVDEIATAWAQTVQHELGRKPMLYRRSQDTDWSGLKSHMGCSYLWAKRYNSELGELTNGWDAAALWQYVGDSDNKTNYPSSPPGIGANDSSIVLYGDGSYADLQALIEDSCV